MAMANMSITMTSMTTDPPSLHSLPLPPPQTRHSTSTSTSTSTSSALSAIDPRQNQHRPVTHVRQLFVGNLPFRVRWQDLKDLFRKVGVVVRADVALSYDNRSKGHGTVLFATVEDAQNAIDMLHNYKWQGRVLEVREDRGFVELPQHQHQQHTTVSMIPAVDGNSEVPGGRQLFVRNLPFHCQWQDVKDLFRNAGNILRADVVQDSDGRSRGFGTVLYATHEDAKTAIAMYNGYEFHGRQLRVHFDKFAPGVGPSHYHHHNSNSNSNSNNDNDSDNSSSKNNNHHIHHSAVPYSLPRFRHDLYTSPPPPPLLLAPYFGLSSPITFQQPQHQHLRSHVDDDNHNAAMLQQLPPFLPFLLPSQLHREIPNHSPYLVSPHFPDERLVSEAQLAASTMGSIGMPFMDSPSPLVVDSKTVLDPNSKLFTPWMAQHHHPLPSEIIHPEEGVFFAPATTTTTVSTTQDNDLTDAVAAMSLSTTTTTAAAAADGSAGLSNTLRPKTASVTAPGPGSGSGSVIAAGNIPPPLPRPSSSSSLLTANSVWEPLGGFKY